MAVFGSVTGRLYLLGRINVPVAGSPQPLSQNVPITSAFGTAANPSPMTANQLVFKAPQNNMGTVYLCFRGGNKSIGNSILWDFGPGGSFTLGSSAESSPYHPADLVVDADTGGDGLRAFAIIGT